ncbi:MAG: response regulator transcription factor [Gammaproteobacteria bacterium]|nr:response regulator transcription factor [Gammaproteobacteria bacterium]MYK82036.1 response regulator transcription factor [Gammaproteobacteria bacterium]
MSKLSVLLVEDHRELAETVAAFLEACGHDVDYAADGLVALHLAVTESYDVMVLDVMLPGMDGFAVCQRLRQDAKVATPIIMLTARDALDDKLTGFNVGADDYLVKPFDMPELAARIEALARRARGWAARYEIGELTLDAETFEVRRQGSRVALTGFAFEVLRVLMREHPKVVSRRDLEREVWQNEPPESDALRSHLYNLRQALDRPFDRPLIATVPGRGYRLDLPEPDEGQRDAGARRP